MRMGYSLLLTKRFGLLGEQYANRGAYLASRESRPPLQVAL